MDDFNSLVDIQRNIAQRLSREVQIDRTIDLLSIIQEIVPDKSGRIQKEAVILEAQNRGISEEDCERLLVELVRNRYIRIEDSHIIQLS